MTDKDESAAKGERIAKRLARAGLCSRRDAERWILEGRVVVDGQILTTPAFVVTEKSRIQVDGKPLPDAEKTKLWRYHKPPGLVTTHKDPEGRPTVFSMMPPDMPRVLSVGRLDLTSEGLLLLTNDGEVARKLEHPTTGWTRRYRVRVHGKVSQDELDNLANGITIDGISYGPIKADLEREKGANAWVNIAIKEGKNREIRRIMEHIGLSVTRLIRVAYGPFQLGQLARGDIEEVSPRVLAEQLGIGKPPSMLPKKEKPQRAHRRRTS
jgi:23S rRNA pseudouridine2605 synthase